MPKLPPDDLKRHRIWLSTWRSPTEMATYVEAVNGRMGSAAFLGQPGVEFLRDAWLATEFGRLRESELVRLIAPAEQWPDFEAKAGGEIERVECGEADLPGRRRHDEYRLIEKQIEDGDSTLGSDPIENWIERAALIPEALAAIVAKKVGKHYAERVSLLIYLNIGEFGIRQVETEAAMATAISPAIPIFTRVWVLWKARLHGPWQA